MSDPDHHAMMEEHVSFGKQLQECDREIEQLRGKVYLATGFLEGMAERLDTLTSRFEAAADCRAMAKKLRGD